MPGPLKITTWNCNMAFRKKAGVILAHQPDILVVPECENPDRLKFGQDVPSPSDIVWHGHNLHKGLGVFSYGAFRLRLLDGHNPAIRTVLPIEVTGGSVDFTLFAIWANHPADPDGPYVEQIWKALKYYSSLLSGKHVVLAGDFNSNTMWDRKSREGNHSAVVELLAAKGIHSTYHLFHRQQQGREAHPTHYLYRHRDKPYHLDYCFASAALIRDLQNVEIGAYDDWRLYSDHKPLTVTFRGQEGPGRPASRQA